MSVLDVPVDAQLSVSDLRGEAVVKERLEVFHRVRIQRHKDVLGVLVDAEAWRAIVAHVQALETHIERLEGQAVRAIIEERAPREDLVLGTAATIADVDRQYRELLRD